MQVAKSLLRGFVTQVHAKDLMQAIIEPYEYYGGQVSIYFTTGGSVYHIYQVSNNLEIEEDLTYLNTVFPPYEAPIHVFYKELKAHQKCALQICVSEV